MNIQKILIIISIILTGILIYQGYIIYDCINLDGSIEDAIQYCNDRGVTVENVNEIPSNDPRYVINGQTQFWSNGTIKILIDQDLSRQDYGATLYHEIYHAKVGPESTEPDADKFSQSYGYKIHDATYQ